MLAANTKAAADRAERCVRWRPGKAYDIAASPDGRWLAVTMGQSVKLYRLPLLRSGSCASSMSPAEVRGLAPLL
jgi:hypothetical protein